VNTTAMQNNLGVNRTLVVVTCYRDLNQLSVLFKSVNLYLEPSKIIIVVNEDDDMKWLVWYDRHKILPQHNVEVIFKNDLFPASSHSMESYNDGWITQQILKLIIATKVVTPEYVLLDTKNFFIKPTSLDSIKQMQAADYFKSIGRDIVWVSAVASKLTTPLTKLISARGGLFLSDASTPYVINTSYAERLISHFGGLEQFVNWFLTTTESLRVCETTGSVDHELTVFISEFYLYELFCTLELGVDYTDCIKINNATFWPDGPLSRDYIDSCIDNMLDDVYVGGLHYRSILAMSSDDVRHVYHRFGLLDSA
jgi:hypothetical protein